MAAVLASPCTLARAWDRRLTPTMIHTILPVQNLRPGGERRTEPRIAAVLQTAVDDCRGSAYSVAAGLPAGGDRRAGLDRAWPA
jgi:hypothetical protein